MRSIPTRWAHLYLLLIALLPFLHDRGRAVCLTILVRSSSLAQCTPGSGRVRKELNKVSTSVVIECTCFTAFGASKSLSPKRLTSNAIIRQTYLFYIGKRFDRTVYLIVAFLILCGRSINLDKRPDIEVIIHAEYGCDRKVPCQCSVVYRIKYNAKRKFVVVGSSGGNNALVFELEFVCSWYIQRE